jgi:hypothetical protein
MYRVYGVTLASQLGFPHLERASDSEPAELSLLVRRPDVVPPDYQGAAQLVWQYRAADRLSLSVYDAGDGFVFHYPSRVQFRLSADLRSVTCTAVRGLDEELIRYLFLGLVLSFILHRRGRPTLHAGAVRVGEGAVAFTAPPGVGKSSLTAYCVRAGHAVLSDDVVPLARGEDGVLALPGVPQLRLWPDAAAALWEDPARLPRHALQTEKRQIWLPLTDRFYCTEPLPVRAIYFLERSERAETEFVSLSRAEAVTALVGSAFGNFLTSSKHLAVQFEFLADAACHVPCRRALVRTGLNALASVYAALMQDLAALAGEDAHEAKVPVPPASLRPRASRPAND